MANHHYLIIGGSSGIGLQIVNALDDPQNRLFVASRSQDKLPDTPNLTYIHHDVTEEEFQTDQLPESLQGLVYCPGTIRLRPFHRLKDEEFVEDFRINVLGAVRSIRACFPLLKKSSSGASIVLFSTVAVQIGMAYHASIASAKGAIEGLTRSLAAEFAPHIRVNAIAPSLTDTPLAQQLLSNDQKRKMAEERHPLKRVGTPQDMADLAVFLLQHQASWITGQIFHVDGGMSSVRVF